MKITQEFGSSKETRSNVTLSKKTGEHKNNIYKEIINKGTQMIMKPPTNKSSIVHGVMKSSVLHGFKRLRELGTQT